MAYNGYGRRADAAAAKTTAVDTAESIIEQTKRERRDMTPAERTLVDELIAKATRAQEAVRIFDGDKAARDTFAGLRSPEAGGVQSFPDGLTVGGGGPRFAAREGPWAKAVRDQLGNFHGKAIAPSGAITVPSPISAEIYGTPDRPTSVLDLIPPAQLSATDSFVYWRETLRDPNASSVEAGQVKPTSLFNIEKVTDRARTIATLSEPMNRADLDDTTMLAEYLEGSLRSAVLLELERLVIAGEGDTTGVLDDFVGILGTSGVQAVPFATDIFLTSRSAITALQVLHLARTDWKWIMSPAAWERFEVAVSSTPYVLADPGTAGASLPIDRARSQLWGQGVVVSTAMPDDDRAILGDFAGSSKLVMREDVRVDWSEAPAVAGATGFERNTITFRAELRAGYVVARPPAYVIVDLTGP